jgi:hypothetical protein
MTAVAASDSSHQMASCCCALYWSQDQSSIGNPSPCCLTKTFCRGNACHLIHSPPQPEAPTQPAQEHQQHWLVSCAACNCALASHDTTAREGHLSGVRNCLSSARSAVCLATASHLQQSSTMPSPSALSAVTSPTELDFISKKREAVFQYLSATSGRLCLQYTAQINARTAVWWL